MSFKSLGCTRIENIDPGESQARKGEKKEERDVQV